LCFGLDIFKNILFTGILLLNIFSGYLELEENIFFYKGYNQQVFPPNNDWSITYLMNNICISFLLLPYIHLESINKMEQCFAVG